MQLAVVQLATVLANANDDGGGGNILFSLLPFLLIGGIMYMLLIRPQRRRMREQAELQKSVGVGDEVITTSGLFGFITGEDGPNRFWLEIDENVQVRISRAAVQQKVDTSVGEDGAKPGELVATDDEAVDTDDVQTDDDVQPDADAS